MYMSANLVVCGADSPVRTGLRLPHKKEQIRQFRCGSMVLSKMRLLNAISLFLMLAGLSGYAQSGADLVTSSPLNGNWNIAGNRQKATISTSVVALAS
jgi:hypothetical protein